jgi:hypothetical protein
MIKRFKEWILKQWKTLKKWLLEHWQYLTNLLVLFIVYGNTTQVGLETITGLWIFSILALTMWRWFNKKKKQ